MQVERDVCQAYEIAGLDPQRPTSVATVCRSLLGRPPRYMAGLSVEACLAWVGSEYQVWVRAGVGPARARWLVGHELGEWWYRDRALPNVEKESLCDAFGAALILPAPIFLRGLVRYGLNVPALARGLKTTQSLALLRYGEVTQCPVALVRRRWATVRGPRGHWPNDLLEREPASVRAAMRVRVTDEPHRTGLLGA